MYIFNIYLEIWELLIFFSIAMMPVLIFSGALMYKKINDLKNVDYSDEVSHGHSNLYFRFFIIAPFDYIYTGITRKKYGMVIQGLLYLFIFIITCAGFIVYIIKH